MFTWTQEDYIQAFRFAAQAHLGQTFPGTDLPYLSNLQSASTTILLESRQNQTIPDRSREHQRSSTRRKPLSAKAITPQD